jgi:hypothetical protein
MASLKDRAKRIIHSLREESAGRVARFLIFDRGNDDETVPAVSNGAVPGNYAQDVARLGNADPHSFPRTIFQTWKSRSVIPSNYWHWRQTFVDINPDYEVLLWDDADNRSFIADRFPWALSVYDSYPKEIFRADAVRFFFLLEFGGMYADMDTECLRPIEPTASSGDVVLCRMGGNPNFEHSIPNAIMSSHPSQIFWLFVILQMFDAAKKITGDAAYISAGPETMTGPVLLKRAYDAFIALDEAEVRSKVAPFVALLTEHQRKKLRFAQPKLLEPHNWYPLDWTNVFQKSLCNRLRANRRVLSGKVGRTLFPRSTVATYWSHSW